MMSPANAVSYTPDDLLTLPDGKQYELVNGELRGIETGAESEWIALELADLLIRSTKEPRSGWVFGAATGYQCFPNDPDQVRKPDASFIRLGRLPHERIPRGHIRIPPDLAAEVVSPHDSDSDVSAKVDEYLEAGVRLVWVVDPETRKVAVDRPDGSTTTLREQDILTGEDVIPEFACSAADLFAPLEEH